jgi:hypothetical protein
MAWPAGHWSSFCLTIVTLLRQIEVFMAQGKSAPEACRAAGISQQNYAMNC